MAILLATRDDDVVGRCRRAVSAEHQLDVVDGAAQVAAKIRSQSPSVVILDSEVLNRPLDHEVAQVVGLAGGIRVIVMTPVFNEEEEIALLKVGAKGCCRRGIDPESLKQVLNVTSTGGVWVTRTLVPRLVSELRRYAQAARPGAAKKEDDKLRSLTQREKDIVTLIVSGSTNKQVAEALDITERTVKGHLSNIFQKLDVPDRLKLVLYVNGEEAESATAGRRR
ncbi:MAG: response regulator transcription factor [Betaproteobacteria bacterium]|nr:response regulator transcription factor [Betaproteobacteria bacterium]